MSGCTRTDVVFALDSSGSIGAENWQRVLNFTKDIIGNFSVLGSQGVQVGVFIYATKVSKLDRNNPESRGFFLDEFETKEEMFAKIDTLPWKDEETNTSGALWYMRQIMFSSEGGARGQANRLGIVVTDGEANRDQNLTAPFAAEAHERGITVLAIGVGDQTDSAELKAIASDRSAEDAQATNMTDFVFNVDSFEVLQSINQDISQIACDPPVGKISSLAISTTR